VQTLELTAYSPQWELAAYTPLDLAFAFSKLTSPIGSAGEVTCPATRESFFGAATSSTTPQAWHSPHLPTHLVVLHPHSEQRNGSLVGAAFFAMPEGYMQPPTRLKLPKLGKNPEI
jgi:hypothetical protein